MSKNSMVIILIKKNNIEVSDVFLKVIITYVGLIAKAVYNN